jgi:hypothetical protein
MIMKNFWKWLILGLALLVVYCIYQAVKTGEGAIASGANSLDSLSSLLASWTPSNIWQTLFGGGSSGPTNDQLTASTAANAGLYGQLGMDANGDLPVTDWTAPAQN